MGALLTLRIFFTPNPAIGGGEVEMRDGIAGLKAHRLIQRGNGSLVFFPREQGPAETQVSVGEGGIQASGSSEMLDRLVILLALARQLPEDEFRTRIARIHPKFELHFLPGLLAGGRIRWLGEQEAPQAEVDARQVRIARKHRSILLSRFVPLALRFQRFGVQLVDLVRLRMVVEERLRGSQREIRVGVNREIQNRRIIREVTRERLEPCRRLTGLIRSERTPNA